MNWCDTDNVELPTLLNSPRRETSPDVQLPDIVEQPIQQPQLFNGIPPGHTLTYFPPLHPNFFPDIKERLYRMDERLKADVAFFKSIEKEGYASAFKSGKLDAVFEEAAKAKIEIKRYMKERIKKNAEAAKRRLQAEKEKKKAMNSSRKLSKSKSKSRWSRK